jgi:hypothetical protein
MTNKRPFRLVMSAFAQFVGLAAVTVGAWDLSRSAGLIVGGVGLVVLGIASEVDR